MKTYPIKDLLKKELLIIETPLNVKDVIFNKGDNNLTWETEHLIISGYDLDDYTLLGKPDEIREEDAKELVEHYETLGYRNYKSNSEFPINIYIYKTATESLLSALESEIFWENPLGKDKPNFDPFLNYGQNEYWVGLKNKWNEAELRTFDRNRSIIFVKN